MSRIRALGELPSAERLLLVQAVGWVAVVRVALGVLPYRHVHDIAGRLRTPRSSAIVAMPAIDVIARSVIRSAALVPGASCLVQAIVTSMMLQRRGHRSEVRVGVRRAGAGIQAHAWVECAGEVVIGDRDDLSTFQVLSGSNGW
jgi:hypothetical protein